jgi:hypothetical protein
MTTPRQPAHFPVVMMTPRRPRPGSSDACTTLVPSSGTQAIKGTIVLASAFARSSARPSVTAAALRQTMTDLSAPNGTGAGLRLGSNAHVRFQRTRTRNVLVPLPALPERRGHALGVCRRGPRGDPVRLSMPRLLEGVRVPPLTRRPKLYAGAARSGVDSPRLPRGSWVTRRASHPLWHLAWSSLSFSGGTHHVRCWRFSQQRSARVPGAPLPVLRGPRYSWPRPNPRDHHGSDQDRVLPAMPA